MENSENMIEWITGQRSILVSFTDPKWIRKVKELAEKHPDKVRIVKINEDGSICAHLPKKSLKLSIIERQLSDEAKAEAAERLKKSLRK